MTKKEFLKKAREVSWIGVEYLARWNNPSWKGMSDIHIGLQLTIDKVKKEIQAWKEGKIPADQVKRIALIHFPRNHGKTTQLLFRILWELGNNPNHKIKIVCESSDNAQKRVVFMQQHIMNNKHLHELFPHLRPAEQGMWNKNQFYVERNIISVDPSVEGCGILTATTGGRATIIFCYDKYTQVLTKEGWKYGLDLTGEEEILAYDPNKLVCRWEKPTNIVKYMYRGPLYTWPEIGLYVTENHKLFNYIPREKKIETLYTGKDEDKFNKVALWSYPMENFREKKSYYLPSPPDNLPPLRVGVRTFGILLGILCKFPFIVDMEQGTIKINKKYFTNADEQARFVSLLRKCKIYFETLKYGGKRYYLIKNPQFFSFIKPYLFNIHKANYAFIPYPLIFELPYPMLQGIWEGLTHWTKEENKEWHGSEIFNWSKYLQSVTSKTLKLNIKEKFEDFLDALSVLVGRHLLKRQNKQVMTHCNWDNFFLSRYRYLHVGKKEVIEEYEGNVWCVSVPSGGLIVRRKLPQKGVAASVPIACGNCDDPIGMHNAITYPENKRKAEEAFYGNWLPMLEEDGFVVIAYTVWTEDDFTYKLEKKKDVCYLYKKVIDDDFNPVWPERWPKEALIAKYNEIGPLQFARSYQGRPASSQDYLFDKEKVLSSINPNLILGKCYEKDHPVFVGVDLAISKKKAGKNTAIVAFQLLPNNKRRVIDIVYGQLSSVATAESILEFIRKYKPIKVFVENNSYQQSLLEWIDVIDKSGISYGVVDGYYTGAQKFDPFKGLPALATEFFKGLWEIPVSSKDHEYDEQCNCNSCRLVTELIKFPHYKTSDLVMALFFAREAFIKTYGETAVCKINFIDISDKVDENEVNIGLTIR